MQNDEEIGGIIKEALFGVLRAATAIPRMIAKHPKRAFGLALGPGFVAYDAGSSAARVARAASEARGVASETLTDVSRITY